MITDLLDSQNGQPTALRAADFKITHGGSDTGGPGGLAGAVQTLAGGGGADPWHESVWRIRVECGYAPFTDCAEIDIGPQGPDAEAGDSVSIELGYRDAGTTQVFKGNVWSIRDISTGYRRLTLTNGSHHMAVKRINMTFQQATTADAALKLASEADVSSGSLAGEITMPAFVAHDRVSAWRHVARLARWEGKIAWVDADNKLQWNSIRTAGPDLELRYGDDIISIEKMQVSSCEISRRWQGEGAAGSNGREAWSWLLKKPDTLGSGNSAEKSLVNFEGAFRSRKSVEKAASGHASLPPCSSSRFMVLSAGSPAAVVGATVSVTGTPQGAMDCTGVVIHVSHLLTKREGYRTGIEIVTPAESAGGLSAGGLL